MAVERSEKETREGKESRREERVAEREREEETVPEEAVLVPVAVAGGVEEVVNWWLYFNDGVEEVVGVEGREREARRLGVDAMVADLDLHM